MHLHLHLLKDSTSPARVLRTEYTQSFPTHGKLKRSWPPRLWFAASGARLLRTLIATWTCRISSNWPEPGSLACHPGLSAPRTHLRIHLASTPRHSPTAYQHSDCPPAPLEPPLPSILLGSTHPGTHHIPQERPLEMNSIAMLGPDKRRRRLTSSSSSSVATMSTSSVDSDSSNHTNIDWDTGFPESFAAVTTSRRHPSAKTGLFAIIEADEVDHQHSLDRKKHALLSKYRRTISHGKITHLEPLAESPVTSHPHTDTHADEPMDHHADDPVTILDRPLSPTSTSSRTKSEKLRGFFRRRAN
ncbi:hypothetical protein MN608_07680 [Microdochium nivale]|nr:hypothetical protein MN608_07680 [Microdochium nivale]